MPSNRQLDELARACVAARNELRRASRVLHDEIGSMLAVAGLRLQLLRMDHPEAGQRSGELNEALEAVMDSVRRLSRELDPTPAGRTGLKNALLDLAEKHMQAFEMGIAVRCTVNGVLPHVVLDALYLAAERTLEVAATRNAKRLAITASGSKAVTVRITYVGAVGVAAKDLQSVALLARAAGLGFKLEAETGKTKESTIVVIRYAV